MSKKNDAVKELLKITANQQKIITKMAQQMGLVPADTSSTSIVNVVNSVLHSMPEAKGISVTSADVLEDGSVRGKLTLPSAMFGTPLFKTVTDKLKSTLAGKTVTTDDGNSCSVSADPMKISFVGMS